jgi:hypothetical protein
MLICKLIFKNLIVSLLHYEVSNKIISLLKVFCRHFIKKNVFTVLEGRVQINVQLFYLSFSFCEESVFFTNGKGFSSRVGGTMADWLRIKAVSETTNR